MKLETAKHSPPALFRWLILFFISAAMFGNYYIYDSISPLADVLKTQLKFTYSDIALLNGIYSFPNILMVLIGGFIIDRIGTVPIRSMINPPINTIRIFGKLYIPFNNAISLYVNFN